MLRSRHELRNAMTHYSKETIASALGEHATMWRWEANSIKAEFTFVDFKTAFDFMKVVAEAAEKMNHHPDWHNSYNRIGISLRTHDQNAVTDLDVGLSNVISRLYKSYKKAL